MDSSSKPVDTSVKESSSPELGAVPLEIHFEGNPTTEPEEGKKEEPCLYAEPEGDLEDQVEAESRTKDDWATPSYTLLRKKGSITFDPYRPQSDLYTSYLLCHLDHVHHELY